MNKIKLINNKQFFIDINDLQSLEQNNKWDDIIILLNNKIIESNNDPDYLIRLIAQYCFMLSEWEAFNFGDNDKYKKIKDELINIYNNTIDKLKNNDKYLFIIGYFSSLFPSFFSNSHSNYNKIEANGKEMLEEVCLNNKRNLLYKYFYLGLSPITNEYKQTKERLIKQVNKYFPNNSNVEKYFKEMICIDN